MNLEYIATNLEKLPRIEGDSWGNAIRDLLTVMLANILGPGLRRDLNSMLIDSDRLEVRALVDVSFSSDEDCILQVLIADGKPVGLCSKFGDRSEWKVRILDVEGYHAMVKEVAAAVVHHRLAETTAKPLERLRDLENHYIQFLGEKETLFAIENPKSVEWFEDVPKAHRCFVVNQDGTVQEVERIGAFADKRHPGWDQADGIHNVHIFVKDARMPRIVDARELMFELVSGEADIADAVASYSPSSRWIVDTVNDRKCLVQVLALRAYERVARVARFKLESDAELKRFCELYFDHDVENQYIDGEFVFTTLGFRGAIVDAA